MMKTLFNSSWRVSEYNDDLFSMASAQTKEVTLPYDAMIHTKRNPAASGKKGFYENGAWEYKKTFFVPKERSAGKTFFLFEGVYQQAMIYINGDFAVHQPYGYSQFLVDADRFLNFGEENEIKVVVRTANDSRWYTGAGIYRDVYMLESGLVYIKPNGVKITTPNIDLEQAVVCVATALRNDGAEAKITTRVEIELRNASGEPVAKSNSPCTIYRGDETVSRYRLYIANPELWDVDTPYMYKCIIRIKDDNGNVLDESVESFGIRSLTLDYNNGLRINGKNIKLKGACIHHDNGPIGSVCIEDAERRRISLLKKSGFNAIRMSHHPAAPALIKACDELGMLVMDEAFDMWTITKSPFDYSLDFPAYWETDIQAMVDKDFNHPSVIMYSIGNEIMETGTPNGTAWARKLAEKVRELDSTRYTTNGVNGMLSVMDLMKKKMQERQQDQPQQAAQGEINTMMANLGEMSKRIMCMEPVTKATEESFACVDIAGYNYMDNRYIMDKELFPGRIIVGSETYTQDIDRNWRMVLDNGYILGDFTWTGWDYIGEVGLGRVLYNIDSIANAYTPYPALTAMAGDFAITGYRRPASYYREIVFGMRTQPYISVQRPEHYNDIPLLKPWSWSDSASHWSWTGFEGKPIKVEVYSHSDEVELFINKTSIGRQPAGEANRFKTIFDTTYMPGEIVAVAYTDSQETGRFSLQTAEGDVQLCIKADKEQVTLNGLVYVDIFLNDIAGNLFANDNRKVQVNVEGSGYIMGFANADPDTEENFFEAERTTYNGHAVAVIRPTEVGSITITVSSEGIECKKLYVVCK